MITLIGKSFANNNIPPKSLVAGLPAPLAPMNEPAGGTDLNEGSLARETRSSNDKMGKRDKVSDYNLPTATT